MNSKLIYYYEKKIYDHPLIPQEKKSKYGHGILNEALENGNSYLAIIPKDILTLIEPYLYLIEYNNNYIIKTAISHIEQHGFIQYGIQEIYKSNSLIEQSYSAGPKNFHIAYYYENGESFWYIGDISHIVGSYKERCHDGCYIECNYNYDGKRDGIYKEFRKNGQPKLEIMYKDGEKISEFQINRAGRRIERRI